MVSSVLCMEERGKEQQEKPSLSGTITQAVSKRPLQWHSKYYCVASVMKKVLNDGCFVRL
jgi:hypothetical protein